MLLRLWSHLSQVMGGSSVLNYMIYNRGHPNDYDNWERLGSEGWGFKDVLPYFKKLENMMVRRQKRTATANITMR